MNISAKLLMVLMLAVSGKVLADLPENWDGLIEVKPKRMEVAYLLPGADFRPYTKVIIDPSVVAFQKNWLRNINTSQPIGVASRRISSSDAQKILQSAQQNFDQVFAETIAKNGFEVVNEPGPDVLHITPLVVDLFINAPDVDGSPMTKTYVMNAGEGTLVLEARDSQTNTLLGRVLDNRETRSGGGVRFSNQSTNVNDFRALVNTWAAICVKGLDELKANSPVPLDLKPKQKM